MTIFPIMYVINITTGTQITKIIATMTINLFDEPSASTEKENCKKSLF